MKEDYFDPDLVSDASPSLTDDGITAAEPEPFEDKPKKRQFFGYDLSTLLIAGSALIALSVYAVWPESLPSQAFIPDERMQQVVQPASNSTSETILPTPSLAMDVQESPALADNDIEEMKQYSAANREAIKVMNGRTSDIEQRLADLETKLQTLATKSAAQPVTPKITVKETPVKKTSHASSTLSKTASVRGWQVHTIYPGMAWITHNGSTWSVQAGDVLQGMTIRSIDVQRRIVITNRGVIR